MRIHEAGRGPVVLCLHGGPSPSSDFEPLVAALQATNRVLVPDLPGYCGEPASATGNLLEDGQAALQTELAHRGIRELVIVGFSLGAYRAFHLALRTDLRVRGIVSLGGFAGLDGRERTAIGQLAATLLQTPLHELKPVLPGRFLSPAFAASHSEITAKVRGWADIVSLENLARELAEVARTEDLRPALTALRVPILARVGELDLAMPPPKSEEIAKAAPLARCEVVKGAGHALFYEDLDMTIASVVGMVRDADSAS